MLQPWSPACGKRGGGFLRASWQEVRPLGSPLAWVSETMIPSFFLLSGLDEANCLLLQCAVTGPNQPGQITWRGKPEPNQASLYWSWLSSVLLGPDSTPPLCPFFASLYLGLLVSIQTRITQNLTLAPWFSHHPKHELI